MDWLIISSGHFDKKVHKYQIPEKRIAAICQELKENQYSGKPLGYSFLREKRYEDKRLYYLVYENIRVVLLVSISDKKTQQETIDAIKESFDAFENITTELARKIRTTSTKLSE